MLPLVVVGGGSLGINFGSLFIRRLLAVKIVDKVGAALYPGVGNLAYLFRVESRPSLTVKVIMEC